MKGIRKCLGCLTEFESEHIGHRRCDVCKNRDDDFRDRSGGTDFITNLRLPEVEI